MSSLTRLNITVPEDVLDTLKAEAGPREQSAFITTCVRHYAKHLRKQRLLRELQEGYQATAKESKDLNDDFDETLSDGLDDSF